MNSSRTFINTDINETHRSFQDREEWRILLNLAQRKFQEMVLQRKTLSGPKGRKEHFYTWKKPLSMSSWNFFSMASCYCIMSHFSSITLTLSIVIKVLLQMFWDCSRCHLSKSWGKILARVPSNGVNVWFLISSLCDWLVLFQGILDDGWPLESVGSAFPIWCQ